MKSNLYIVAIGPVASGKTTMLTLLTELLWEEFAIDNIKGFQHDTGKMLGHFKKDTYGVLLIDNIRNKEQLTLVVNDFNPIVICISKNENNPPNDNWLWQYPSTVTFRNPENFRLFKFQLKDLLYNNIIKTKQWKDAMI